MIQIAGIIKKAKAEGYDEVNAQAKVCQDIDLDFIRYPLQDEAIRTFNEKLNSVGQVSIQTTGGVEELRQQDYHGKRIHIAIWDADGYSLSVPGKFFSFFRTDTTPFLFLDRYLFFVKGRNA